MIYYLNFTDREVPSVVFQQNSTSVPGLTRRLAGPARDRRRVDYFGRSAAAADSGGGGVPAQRLRRLLGHTTPEDFSDTLKAWSSRLHPEDSQRTIGAFVAHVDERSGKTPFDVAYRLRHKSGEYRWFRDRGKTRRAPDSSPLHVVGAITDIHRATRRASCAGPMNDNTRRYRATSRS